MEPNDPGLHGKRLGAACNRPWEPRRRLVISCRPRMYNKVQNHLTQSGKKLDANKWGGYSN